MPLNLVKQNIVIYGEQLNPAIYDALWLVGRQIVNERDLVGPRIQTPILSAIKTADLEIVVLPERIQAAPIDPLANDDRASHVIRRTVRELPGTAYRAIGINFQWQLLMEPDSIQEFSRNAFLKSDDPFWREAGAVGGIAGASLTSLALEGRRKIFIDPLIPDYSVTAPPAGFVIDFNYHYDATDGAMVEQALAHRQAAHEETDRLAHLLVR
jgi:hypothetical protein